MRRGTIGDMETFYSLAGGTPAIHRFVDVFYSSVLKDPLLQPLFGEGEPSHVDHLTKFLVEIFEGPDDFTQKLGGYQHIVDVHRGLKVREEQRLRFVELYLAAARQELPDDPLLQRMLEVQVEVGSQIVKQNSNATTDAELHPDRDMPIHRVGDYPPEP